MFQIKLWFVTCDIRLLYLNKENKNRMLRLLLFICCIIPVFLSCNDNKPKVVVPGFKEYKEAVAPDATGMNIEVTSMELSKKLKVGFNVGNTFEAVYKDPDGNLSGDETIWGNPTPNAALFKGIKAAGFNFVRMPVSFSHQLADSGRYEIKKEWMDKVAKAVDDAIDAGLYIMINIHWDGGWMDHPNDRYKDVISERFEAYWKQIALRFRDYDDRLLFAGMNEVADADTDMWNVPPTEENLRVQNGLNQLFVNVVRATGGCNYYRYLVLPSYLTNIGYAVSGFEKPMDVVENRTFIECHFYDPFEFCLKTDEGYKTVWGKPFKDAGYDVPNWGLEDELEETLASLNKFTDKNIPVMIGEWGSIARIRGELEGEELERHIDSRDYYYWYVTKTCLKHNLLPVNWDIGLMFKRRTGEQNEVSNINAIMKAVTGEDYVFTTIQQGK